MAAFIGAMKAMKQNTAVKETDSSSLQMTI
jgi:hypothetical protein